MIAENEVSRSLSSGILTIDTNLLLSSLLIRIVTASISFLASATMVYAIFSTKMNRGVCRPYSRVILGLSLSEMVKSISIITGPLAPPPDTPQALWAIGNTRTCDVQGFFMASSAVASVMYTFLLTFYFLLRVKHGMSREQFALQVERKFHAFILLFSICGNAVALFNKNFNANIYGMTCSGVSFPLYCNSDAVKFGQCTRGKNARLIQLVKGIIPTLLSHLGMIACLVMLTWHVFRSKKDNRTTSTIGKSSNVVVSLNQGVRYDRQILVQSCLYACGLLFNYLPIYINMSYIITKKVPPFWNNFLTSLTWPIGGLTLILIYTRPKIMILRMRRGHLTWMRAFIHVILAGAEVPDEFCEHTSRRDSTKNKENQAQLQDDVQAGREIDSNIAQTPLSPNADNGDSDEKEDISEIVEVKKVHSAIKSFMNRTQHNYAENLSAAEVSSELAPEDMWSEQMMSPSDKEELDTTEAHKYY